jgi:hypothetical protein
MDARGSLLPPGAFTSLLVALVAIAIALSPRRARHGSFAGDSTAWALAAAALVSPAAATFMAVRFTINTFGHLASGGGIAATSAGLWEALQPIFYALCSAAVILIAALVLFLASDDDETPSEQSRASRSVGLLLSGLTVGFTVTTVATFLSLTRLVVRVLDPKGAQEGTISQVAQLVSSKLIVSALTALIAIVLALGTLTLWALASRSGSHTARATTVIALVLLITLTLAAVFHIRAWSHTLREIAITGGK